MIPAPQLTDEQREALRRSVTETLRTIQAALEAIAQATANAAKGFAAFQEAFALAPPPEGTTPYDKCRCTGTQAGLELCARCPGNTPKEPTS